MDEIDRVRKWRLEHPEKTKESAAKNQATWREKNRKKERVENLFRWHLGRGHAKKPNKCEKCGEETKIEAHHPDYSKVMLVVWLCRTCHKLAHKRERLERLIELVRTA